MTHQTTPYGLRMPDDLRAQVKALAAREGRSMNSQIVQVLKNAVDANGINIHQGCPPDTMKTASEPLAS